MTELKKFYLQRKKYWPLIIMSLLIMNFSVIMISMCVGPADISLLEILSVLRQRVELALGFNPKLVIDKTKEVIIFQIRLPRAILASLVGGALATAGAALQGMFRNPMADPYVIGVSSGAALGASLAIVLGLGYGIFGVSTITIMAFAVAVVSLLVVYNISRIGQRVPVMTLLLSGIAVSIFLSAIVSLLHIIAGEKLHALVFWLMGGFSYSEWIDVYVMLPFTCLGFLLIYVLARELNILQLGEEEASYLGVEVEKVKRNLIIFVSLLTASAVSVSGLIGFIGLIIPHMVRLTVGSDHRILLPSALIVGATFLVICDIITRVIIPPAELPVGIITAFAGVPFFIYLLRKTREKHLFYSV